MLTVTGLVLFVIVTAFLAGVLWRFDKVIEGEGNSDGAKDGEVDRIVTQIAAAQRLRREAAATEDAEERARLIRFADEADGTAEKIRRGLLSDQ